MVSFDPVIKWFIDSFLSELAVAILLTGLAFLNRKKILAWVRNLNYYLLNEEVRVKLKRIDKFSTEPERDIDYSLYQRLQEETSAELSNPAPSENALQIEADTIPTKINIRLENVHNFNDMGPDITGYKVITETDSELRFGYRTDEALKSFESLSNEIAGAVQRACFPGEQMDQSYVLGEMKRGIPAGTDEIEDEDLGLSAHVQDSSLQMTFKNPQYLSEAIRKYFKPV
jgi:hypothetical protein